MDSWTGAGAKLFAAAPPTFLVLIAILSVQFGGALATTLFSALSPVGTAVTTSAFAALTLSVLSRGEGALNIRAALPWIFGFGLAFSCLLLPYFLALQRIPLGVVSAVALLGPLSLATAASRRALQFFWIALALLGVLLLTPRLGGDLDPVGLGYAFLCAGGWAGFVFQSGRAGERFSGMRGLALGMWASTFLQAPFALAEGSLAQVKILDLLATLPVALLVTVIPTILEFQALRRMSARIYGVLATLEPATGTLIGALCLGQALTSRTAVAIVCVSVAALGMTLTDPGEEKRLEISPVAGDRDPKA